MLKYQVPIEKEIRKYGKLEIKGAGENNHS